MKPKILFFLLVSLFLFLPHLTASELAPKGTWQRKFQRGLLNTAFAPVELSRVLAREKKRDTTVLPSWIQGASEGIYFTAIRAVTGVYEVLTAPIPCPPGYQPFMKPEFALEHLGVLKDEEPTP